MASRQIPARGPADGEGQSDGRSDEPNHEPDDELSGELSRSRKRAVLAICCSSLFMGNIDNTIVNVALPVIGHDFRSALSGLQWTVDAYTLVLASLLMLAGSTADRVGRRRTFETGLATFTAGSLLCSVAPNLDLLIAFRMLQAVGGSMLNPVAMSIITNTFRDRRERAQAIGLWSAVIGVSLGLGPVVGGALVDSVGWRAIFWINVPIGVAAFVLTRRFVPESRAAHARRPDPIGQCLVIGVLASVTFGIIEGPYAGWSSPEIVAVFALAVASLAALLLYEPRRDEPLIDLRFFASAPFSGATVIAACSFAGLGGFLFLNTLYLQEGRGLSPLAAGLDTLPMALVAMFVAPLSGRFVGAHGARYPLLLGGASIGLGAAMLTHVAATTSFTWLFASYVVFGLGFGVVNAPITNTAVSGMPVSQAGVAAGVASSSRQVGQSLGVAVVGALAVRATEGGLASAIPAASHAGWWVLTGCGATIVGVGVLTTGRWARRTALVTARRLAPTRPESTAFIVAAGDQR